MHFIILYKNLIAYVASGGLHSKTPCFRDTLLGLALPGFTLGMYICISCKDTFGVKSHGQVKQGVNALRKSSTTMRSDNYQNAAKD